MEKPARRKHPSRRLASLDGLRAIAVGIVMLSHAAHSSGSPGWLLTLSRFLPGKIGVQVFFTISGFIITHLLLQEWKDRGRIDLAAFWLRRALRILPPVLVLLGILALLNQTGWLEVSASSQWASLLFVRNHAKGGWMNGHLWSLSVEEQFYLLWPLCLAGLLAKSARPNFFLLVLAGPAARALFTLWQRPDLADLAMLGNIDCLGLGCWLACHRNNQPVFWPSRLVQAAASRWWLLLPVIAGISFSTTTRFAGPTSIIHPLLVSFTTLVLIQQNLSANPTRTFRVLNDPWLMALGRMSYSLYLWQQLFLCPPNTWLTSPGPIASIPLNVLAALLTGWLSFVLIEQPFVQLRQRLHTWSNP